MWKIKLPRKDETEEEAKLKQKYEQLRRKKARGARGGGRAPRRRQKAAHSSWRC